LNGLTLYVVDIMLDGQRLRIAEVSQMLNHEVDDSVLTMSYDLSTVCGMVFFIIASNHKC